MTAQQMREPTAQGVQEAMQRIRAILPPTPLIESEIDGIRVWLKDETAQPIRAFKIRGAWNRLTAIPEDRRAAGVVGVSSGNHAQGVAWAARRLGMAATIVMPSDAPQIKLDRVRELGASIVLYERMTEDREVIARGLCAESCATYVHAFGDPWVIEGQGTAGLELAEQLGDAPGLIVAPCGGGGLSAGLALACPAAAIQPVEPEGWDDVARSLAAGKILPVGPNPPPTICDALQTLATHPLNFAVLQRRASPGLAVGDAEVCNAQRFAHRRHGISLEPGGAVALAAALAGKVVLNDRTVIILTGGNVDPMVFQKQIAPVHDD